MRTIKILSAVAVAAVLCAAVSAGEFYFPEDGAAFGALPAGGRAQSPSVPAPTRVKAGVNKVIIGDDGRLEVYEAAPSIRELAGSVAALIRVADPAAAEAIPAKTEPLCPSERFSEQPSLAFCTGFLVGPDLVATSGHCVTNKTCPTVKIVFGFALKNPRSVPRRAGLPGDTYACSEVLERQYTVKSRKEDYALLRLDRPVSGREPLKLRAGGGMIPEGTEIFTIGHPMGLPMKVAGGAYVRASTSLQAQADKPDDMGGNWFATSLDSTGGNSGGPVFNAGTGLVEGIMARSGGLTSPEFDITPAGCKITRVYDEAVVWGPEVNTVASLAAAVGKWGGADPGR